MARAMQSSMLDLEASGHDTQPSISACPAQKYTFHTSTKDKTFTRQICLCPLAS
eukprot:c15129_g2_i1 orf=117-278(+)